MGEERALEAEVIDDRWLGRILASAKAHGRLDDPDHEVGDLQDALRLAWERLTPTERAAVARDYFETHEDEAAVPLNVRSSLTSNQPRRLR